jgi:hypothetical protein
MDLSLSGRRHGASLNFDRVFCRRLVPWPYNRIMHPADSIWRPNRALVRVALIGRDVVCELFFEDSLSEHPNWDWAIKGLWYSKKFHRCLASSPVNTSRCIRLARNARRRFRCSVPAELAVLGRDVVKWIAQE